MRLRASGAIVCALLTMAAAGCGGGGKSHATTSAARAAATTASSSSSTSTATTHARSAQTASSLGFPETATRNTTRVAGSGPVADAAGVALAVYPSVASGTHPSVVTIAPTNDWEAAIASSVLMAPPLHAPVLLAGSGALPAPTADALKQLAPTGSGSVSGAQVVLVGRVPKPSGLRAATIGGAGRAEDPYAAAAQIDRFATAAAGGHASPDVVIASTSDPAYAMPAAGWAAESGDPILFVSAKSIPKPTIQALQAHSKPRIYVLGPPSVISAALVKQLGKYGSVKRISGNDPSSNSVAFAVYRDPPCKFGQACAHVPGSFGWAMRSPGHGYTLLNPSQPLAAAASAALSGSGDYGPQLLVDNGSTLSKPVLNFFLDYATPGFTQEGPTAAVYNHAWIIGNTATISVTAQAEADELLQAIPQTTSK
jgi:hypothetical protein